MKISKLMTKDAACCDPADALPAAAALMWKRDCGMIPVVKDSRVVGVITDRDIAIAVTTRPDSAGDIRVSDVSHRRPITCSPDENVESALKKMGKNRVRRLPVVDEDGILKGVLSISDVLDAARKKRSLAKKTLKAMRKISSPCPIVLSEMK